MEIEKIEQIYSGFLKVEKREIKLSNGEKILREIINKKNSVAIVAVTEDGEIFLTKQPRPGPGIEDSVEIPAGIIENESPKEAAKRELLEETGCISDELIYLAEFFGDVGCCTGKTYLYLALNCKKVKDLELDEDEFLISFKMKKEAVYKMLDNNEFKDAHSIIGFLKARKYLDV